MRQKCFLLQLFDKLHRFVENFGVALLYFLHHAGLHVILEDSVPEALQRAFHSGYLRENISALEVIVQHVLYSAQLTDNAVEAVVELAQSFLVAGSVFIVTAGAGFVFLVHDVPPYIPYGGMCSAAILYP